MFRSSLYYVLSSDLRFLRYFSVHLDMPLKMETLLDQAPITLPPSPIKIVWGSEPSALTINSRLLDMMMPRSLRPLKFVIGHAWKSIQNWQATVSAYFVDGDHHFDSRADFGHRKPAHFLLGMPK
jgi:hypothetical protein